MLILKILFRWLRKFFSSKAGKTTAKVIVGGGIGLGAGAGVEVVVAHKRNKRAEIIKARAIEKHNAGLARVEDALTDLGKIKLSIYNSFVVLADALEQIQQRPDFEQAIGGVELPVFKPAEFKQLAMTVEVAVGGVGGAVAGSAVGVAVMGTGSILALAPGVLFSGVVLCAMGAKMLQRSAEKVRLAKKIESDVDNILIYYNELGKTAKRFQKALLDVQEQYSKHIRKLQRIVTRKTNWDNFSKAERLVVKNVILLSQLLCRMCAVNLVLPAPKGESIEQVNTVAVDTVILDATSVQEQMKMGDLYSYTTPAGITSSM